MRFGPVPLPPPPAGRLSRARNYSQFRVNESKTIRIAAQTRAPERERRRREEDTKSTELKRERRRPRGPRGRPKVRERARYQDGPLSYAIPGRCPLSVSSPRVSSAGIRSWRHAGPYPVPLARAAGGIFKFCHVQV